MSKEWFNKKFNSYFDTYINVDIEEMRENLNQAMEKSILVDEDTGARYKRYLLAFGGPNISMNFYEDDIKFSFGWFPNHKEISIRGSKIFNDLYQDETYDLSNKSDLSNFY